MTSNSRQAIPFPPTIRRGLAALLAACLIPAALPAGAQQVALAAVPAAAPEQAMPAVLVQDRYLTAARQALQAAARYPNHPATRADRSEGIARVEFVVGSDGEVRELALRESSRVKTLDRAALAAVRHADLPTFAADAAGAPRRLVATFDFRFVPAE